MKKKILFALGAFLFLFFIANASASLVDNLVSYWNFDTNSSANLLDVATGNYNGTGINGAVRVSGLIGNAWELNLGNPLQYINLSDPSALQPSENLSISLWINASTAISSTGEFIFRKRNDGYLIGIGAGSGGGVASGFAEITALVINSTGNAYVTSPGLAYNDSAWHNVVLTRNMTTLSLYMDGVLVNSTATSGSISYVPGAIVFGRDGNSGTAGYYFNGTLDEAGFWDRSLEQNEITTLYNGGNGNSYPFGVGLNYPSNNGFSSDYFNATVASFNQSLTNATLYVYNLDGSVELKTSNSISGEVNQTSFSVGSTLSPGIYLWNVLGCSTTSCEFAVENYTVNFGADVNSITYDASTYETAGEQFILNLTLSDLVSFSSATFYYNGISQGTSTKTTSGDNTIFSTTMDIPTSSTDQNYEFYWQINLNGELFNTSTSTQSVSDWSLNWTTDVNISLLTINILDEETGTVINSTSLTSIINYWYYTGTGATNNTLVNTNDEQDGIYYLTLNDFFIDQFEISPQMSYSAAGYQLRNYFGNLELTNTSTQNLTLYLLLQDSGIINRYRIISEQGNLIPGALVQGYKIDGLNQTLVDTDQSDDSGLANLFLDPDYQYNIVASSSNCQTKSQVLSAVSSDVQTITLTCNDAQNEYNSGIWQTYYNVSIRFSPTLPSIPQNNITTFSVNVTDSDCLLSSIDFSLNNNGSTLNSTSSASICGATLQLSLNVTQNGTIISEADIVKNGTAFTVSYPYTIINFNDLVAVTDKNFYDILTQFSDFGSEIGLSQNTKTFVAFLILFGILSSLSLTSGTKGESIAVIILAWIYVSIMSFIGWFTVGLSPFQIMNQYSIWLLMTFIGGSVILTKSQT